jgi:DNA-binding beta-propeller fold protein YncE
MNNMNRFLILAALAASFTQSATLHAAGKPEYVSGLSFGKQDHLPQVSSLAVGKDDFLVVASRDKVFIYDPAKEQSVRSFDSGLTNITAVATDGETIYVFTRKTEIKDMEYQGRKYKRAIPVGAICKKFAWDGAPAGDLELKDLKDVINAKVVAGKIYIADFGGSHTVRVFDAKTGAALAAIGKDLRLCCGILDFAVDPKTGDVIIGNLGAFKVERYSPEGRLKSSFGQRGEKLESFQGCCNPVSAGVLPDGNLVVVEKDPSRVKVYTPEGKMLGTFKNLKELVKGCSQVSVAVDSKGRVYLGVNSTDRFVLQYVPKS